MDKIFQKKSGETKNISQDRVRYFHWEVDFHLFKNK